MNRFTLIATASLALALAACGGEANRSVNTVKAPVVETQAFAYDLNFGGYDSLPAAQARALDEYLASISIGYGDRISIDDPQPLGASARRAAIAGVVAKYGLLLEQAGPVTAGQLAPGTVRVVVSRATARVEGCPDWSRESNPEIEASAMSNFGCAGVSNLAAMVADPMDLIEPRAYEGADGTTTSKAIKSYRDQKPTGSQGVAEAATAIATGATAK